MGTAFYKTWELLIWKSFCIDQTADSKSGRKDMKCYTNVVTVVANKI